MILVSRGSTLHGQFPTHSLACVSRTAIFAIVHCKVTDQLNVKTCLMSMTDGVHSTFLGLLVPLGKRRESITTGQVAMATNRGNRCCASIVLLSLVSTRA